MLKPIPPKQFDLNQRSWQENERLLLAQCVAGEDVALIHWAQDGIVVPRSYQGNPLFEQACSALLAENIPVSTRLSGGGVVPQMAGVINVHWAYRVACAHPLQQAEQHYLLLCRFIQHALVHFGIHSDWQTVSGSFCDGRFNLAVNNKKIAGTAQYWQRIPNKIDEYAVLSHAVIVAADPILLTERANRLETALNSTIRYDADKTTSFILECDDDAESLFQQLHHQLTIDWVV